MNIKAISIFTALLCLAGVSQAQYNEDAIRFSQPENGSSARFKSMGNASTSLGGDLSSISGNPAGLGFFNTSDAGLTLNYLNDQNKSTYYGTSTNSSSDHFAFNQAGVVFHMPVRSRFSRNTGWLNFNIGIGYARTNDFNSTIDFMGDNNNSSYTDFLADAANDPVFEEWGTDSYLLDYNDTDNYYFPSTSELPNTQGNLDARTGSQHQTNIAFGANYSNKFYIGASIGVAGFNYRSSRRFDEVGIMKNEEEFRAINAGSQFLDPANVAYDFLDADYELSYSSVQKTNGTGFNGTIGMIIRPDNIFQIGLSATTPTWYNVTDDYSMYFDSWMVDPNTQTDFFSYQSDEELYYDEYDLRTPYRLNAGVSAKFEEGLITADVEFVDYTSMKITTASPSANLDSEQQIKEDYKAAANFRLGGEYKLSNEFLLRAGYNYRGNPYQDLSSTKQTVSAGIGYRISNMYLDLAYLNEQAKLDYTPYQSVVNPADPANIKNSRNNVFLTVGFKF